MTGQSKGRVLSAAAPGGDSVHSPAALSDPFEHQPTADDRGTDGDFAFLIDAVRSLQEAVSAAAPPTGAIVDATQRLSDVARTLRAHRAREGQQFAGQLFAVSGRGQALAPVLHVEESADDWQRACVRFGRFYLGFDGAAHAGAIPLAFSEFLGWLSMSGGRSRTRTAYLHVDYRSPTPIDTDLRISGWFEREEGRKRFLRGTLHAGERLCAEAEALYVALRP
jgi:hypothetical protein